MFAGVLAARRRPLGADVVVEFEGVGDGRDQGLGGGRGQDELVALGPVLLEDLACERLQLGCHDFGGGGRGLGHLLDRPTLVRPDGLAGGDHRDRRLADLFVELHEQVGQRDRALFGDAGVGEGVGEGRR